MGKDLERKIKWDKRPRKERPGKKWGGGGGQTSGKEREGKYRSPSRTNLKAKKNSSTHKK